MHACMHEEQGYIRASSVLTWRWLALLKLTPPGNTVYLSCSKWLMPKERLLQCQQEDRAKGLLENHIQQLKVYFTQCEPPTTSPAVSLQQSCKNTQSMACISSQVLVYTTAQLLSSTCALSMPPCLRTYMSCMGHG
jgi:hypothetical protein